MTKENEKLTLLVDDAHLLDYVSEREIDFGLLAAIYSSAIFRSFLIDRIAGWRGNHRLLRARLSDWDGGRETDVLLVAELSNETTLAIMIEDKIGAPFQPDQAAGYRGRGLRGIKDGRWQNFMTCLCAPHQFIETAKVADEWDAYISFESIIEFAITAQDRMTSFVAAICKQALAKRSSELLPMSEKATEFFRAYRKLATDLLPEAPISRLPDRVSVAQQWPRFGANLLPEAVFIEHKTIQGRVDLTFDKATVDFIKARMPVDLPLDVRPERTGKSAALRIVVPKIDGLRPFDEQQDEVIMAFAAVERLLTLGKRMASSLPAT